jgi:predicted translin family RNA/ssDNA-binding protein
VKNPLIAQIAVNPSQPPETNNTGQITINPNLIGGVGGIGVVIWAIVQVILRIWEKQAITQIAAQTVKNEAEVSQEQKALGTLTEVFQKSADASIELQGKAYTANANLVSQLSSISMNAAEARYEGIKESLDRIADSSKEFNSLFRQSTAAIADLSESIKALDWKIDNLTKDHETSSKDFISGLGDVSKTVNKIEGELSRRIGNASAPTN